MENTINEELENKESENTTSRQLKIHCVLNRANNIWSSKMKKKIYKEFEQKEIIYHHDNEKFIEKHLRPTTSGLQE